MVSKFSAVEQAPLSFLPFPRYSEAHSNIISGNFDYFLGSRVTQDCLENVFSLVRAAKQRPGPHEVTQILRNLIFKQVCNKFQLWLNVPIKSVDKTTLFPVNFNNK